MSHLKDNKNFSRSKINKKDIEREEEGEGMKNEKCKKSLTTT